MPGEPVCRRERRAGESVVDSGYMETGGKGCGQPADGARSRGPYGAVDHVRASGRRTDVVFLKIKVDIKTNEILNKSS